MTVSVGVNNDALFVNFFIVNSLEVATNINTAVGAFVIVSPFTVCGIGTVFTSVVVAAAVGVAVVMIAAVVTNVVVVTVSVVVSVVVMAVVVMRGVVVWSVAGPVSVWVMEGLIALVTTSIGFIASKR